MKRILKKYQFYDEGSNFKRMHIITEHARSPREVG
jgi:hypothetical protein